MFNSYFTNVNYHKNNQYLQLPILVFFIQTPRTDTYIKI